jgi:hypothetical protein
MLPLANLVYILDIRSESRGPSSELNIRRKLGFNSINISTCKIKMRTVLLTMKARNTIEKIINTIMFSYFAISLFKLKS